MLQKVAHTVEGLKSVSQPALKAILSRVYLVHASLVGGVGTIVVTLLPRLWRQEKVLTFYQSREAAFAARIFPVLSTLGNAPVLPASRRKLPLSSSLDPLDSLGRPEIAGAGPDRSGRSSALLPSRYTPV